MASRYWKRNDKGELVEIKKKTFNPRKTPYIGKNPWARTTKVEFNTTTVEESMKKMRKGRR